MDLKETEEDFFSCPALCEHGQLPFAGCPAVSKENRSPLAEGQAQQLLCSLQGVCVCVCGGDVQGNKAPQTLRVGNTLCFVLRLQMTSLFLLLEM